MNYTIKTHACACIWKHTYTYSRYQELKSWHEWVYKFLSNKEEVHSLTDTTHVHNTNSALSTIIESWQWFRVQKIWNPWLPFLHGFDRKLCCTCSLLFGVWIITAQVFAMAPEDFTVDLPSLSKERRRAIECCVIELSLVLLLCPCQHDGPVLLLIRATRWTSHQLPDGIPFHTAYDIHQQLFGPGSTTQKEFILYAKISLKYQQKASPLKNVNYSFDFHLNYISMLFMRLFTASDLNS